MAFQSCWQGAVGGRGMLLMGGGERLPSQHGRDFFPRAQQASCCSSLCDHDPHSGRPAAFCSPLPSPFWLPWAVTPRPERGCCWQGLRRIGQRGCLHEKSHRHPGAVEMGQEAAALWGQPRLEACLLFSVFLSIPLQRGVDLVSPVAPPHPADMQREWLLPPI